MKIKKSTYIFFTILFLIIIFSCIVISSNSFKGWILSKIETNIEDSYKINIQYSSFKTNYFSWFEFYDFIVVAEDKVLNFQTLKAEYKFFSLLQKKIEFSNIFLDNLTLIVEDQLKKNGVADSTESQPRSNNFSFSISNFDLRNSNIIIKGTSLPINFSIKDIDLKIEKNSNSNYFMGNINIHSIQLNESLIFNDMSAECWYSNNSLNLIKLTTLFDNSPITCIGNLELKHKFNFDLDINGTFNTSKISEVYYSYKKKYLPVSTGSIQVFVNLFGQLDNIKCKSTVISDSLRIKNLLITKLDICLNYEKELFFLNSLKFDCYNGSVNGNGQLSLNTKIVNKFDLIINKIDIHDFLSNYYQANTKLNGILDGSLLINLYGLNLTNIACLSDLKISQARLGRKNIGDIVCNLSVENKMFNLHYIEGADYITAKGWFTKQMILDAEFNIYLRSVATFLSYLNIPHIDGSVNVQGAITGLINKPQIKSSINITDAFYKNFKLLYATGGLNFNNGKIYFDDIQFYGEADKLIEFKDVIKIPVSKGSVDYSGYI